MKIKALSRARQVKVGALFVALLLTMGCPREKPVQPPTAGSLARAATLLEDVSLILSQATDVVLQANGTKPPGLTNDETRKILSVMVRVGEARTQASRVVRSLNELDPNSKISLYGILHPVASSMDVALISDVAGVHDPQVRDQITALFTVLQSTLRSLDLIFQ